MATLDTVDEAAGVVDCADKSTREINLAIRALMAAGQRTIAVIPRQIWRAAVLAAGGTPSNDDFQQAHQLTSAMLLTDALRRGAF